MVVLSWMKKSSILSTHLGKSTCTFSHADCDSLTSCLLLELGLFTPQLLRLSEALAADLRQLPAKSDRARSWKPGSRTRRRMYSHRLMCREFGISRAECIGSVELGTPS